MSPKRTCSRGRGGCDRRSSPSSRGAKRYRLELSSDGRAWRAVAQGEFSNIANALTPQRIGFAADAADFVRLTLIGLARQGARVAVAELQLSAP